MNRAQLNFGIFPNLSETTIIGFGDCTGENTFEIVCEVPELFDNLTDYEAVVENDLITKIVLK